MIKARIVNVIENIKWNNLTGQERLNHCILIESCPIHVHCAQDFISQMFIAVNLS